MRAPQHVAGVPPPQRRQRGPCVALQRHQLEVALICASGARLGAALALAGQRWAGAGLLLLHGAALALEFAPRSGRRLASPHQLRACESHGVAQGTLAVPSVLAALAAASPQGGWQRWLLGSCSAAVATLCAIAAQSAWAAAAGASEAGGRSSVQQGGSGSAVGTALQQDQPPSKQHRQRASGCGSKQRGSRAFVVSSAQQAALCALAAAAVLWLSPGSAPSWQPQLLQPRAWASLLRRWLAGAVAAAATPASRAVVAWAALSCVGFSGSLQLLPGCFSLGEAALMAQGAACLAVATAGALPRALLFVPQRMCGALPAGARRWAVQHGGCTAAAHAAALSVEALSPAIVLVLSATLLACLLLRLLLPLVRPSSSSSSHSEAAAAPAAAAPAAELVHVNGLASGGSAKHANGAAASAPLSRSQAAPGAAAARPAARLLSRACRWPVALGLAAGIAVLLAWLACAAAWTLVVFLPAREGRLAVLAFWAAVLAVALPALRLWASHVRRMPQIIVRKGYHLLSMALFVPVLFWDLPLLCLSLSIAFAALVLLEVLRCMRLPGLGAAVQAFMQEFVDARDAGVIYITHFTLLLGLAVPVWLTLGLPGARGLLHQQQPAAAAAARLEPRGAALQAVGAGLAGLVIIGVGDTAASLVGKLLGRLPVHAGSRKTVEGTVAGIASSLGAWALLLAAVGLLPPAPGWWAGLVAATAGAGLLEAATSQLDNILLPLWYLPHLLLL